MTKLLDELRTRYRYLDQLYIGYIKNAESIKEEKEEILRAINALEFKN